MKKILLVFISFVWLLAHPCDTKVFNLKAYNKNGAAIRIKDVLLDLSNSCDISIIFEDKAARQKIYKPLDFVNIKDYTLEELLEFLLGENNLFYDYDPQKRVLKISYYKTKNFVIDYLNLSSMVSESRKSVSLGTQIAQNEGESSGLGGLGGYGGGETTGEQSGGESTDYTTITTKSEFTFWTNLERQLNALLLGVSGKKDFTIFINKDASLITVTGTKRELEKVQQFIDRLTERMHKQVLIEAKLIEVTYNDSQTYGIDWSQFAMDTTGRLYGQKERRDGVTTGRLSVPNYFIGYNFNVQGLFDFLKRYGDVKVLSNPKILTLNNQPAIINVGDQISYRYQTGSITYTTTGNPAASNTYAIGSSFIGITLYVIPEITENNEIIMKINPVTSELLRDQNASGSALNYDRTLPPDVKIKQITSIVKVKDGQKVLIGGLISKDYSNQNNKVPILGDVPVIGRLFHSTKKSKKRSELFILIMPKIVKEHNMPTIDELKIFGER